MTIVAAAKTNAEVVGLQPPTDCAPCLLRLFPSDSPHGLIELTGQETLIGRAPHCEVVLSGDEAVAREHAVIESADAACWIRDGGSLHGTFVNDKRVTAQWLAPGDQIRIGNSVFRFLSAESFEEQYHDAVYELATVDGLTGAHSPRYFEDAFERELLRAQRHWRPIALLLFDVDGLRRINDQWGRPAGNACLRDLCKLVGSRIRGEDLFARWGPQRFALALTEAPLKQSVRVAQDLRRLVENQSFATARGSIDLTISIGVGFANGQGPITSHEILQQAVEHLARAKADGRNCVRY